MTKVAGDEIYELSNAFTTVMQGGTGANLTGGSGSGAQLSAVRYVIKKYRVLSGGDTYTAPVWISVAGDDWNSGSSSALTWTVGMSGYGTIKSVAGEDYIAMTNQGSD